MRESRRADRELATVKHEYRDTVLTSYVGGSPALDTFSAMLDADGLSSLLDREASAGIIQGEFEEKRAAYEAAAGDAEDAAVAAEDAAADAEDAATDALAAKEDAEAAVAAAAAAADSVTAEKTRLLRRMARLEGISVDLAEERQAALEQERQEQAALQAQLEQQAQQEQEEQQAEEEPEPPAQEDPPADEPDTDEPTDEPDTDDPPPPPPTRPGRRRGRGRVRPRPARRAVRLGRRRTGLVGLLGPDHGRVGSGRQVAPALLRRPVRAVDADLGQRPAARRPGLLGIVEQRRLDLPRRAVRRRRHDHPRPAHRPAGDQESMYYWIPPTTTPGRRRRDA